MPASIGAMRNPRSSHGIDFFVRYNPPNKIAGLRYISSLEDPGVWASSDGAGET